MRKECKCGSSIEVEGEWDRITTRAMEDFDYKHTNSNCEHPSVISTRFRVFVENTPD